MYCTYNIYIYIYCTYILYLYVYICTCVDIINVNTELILEFKYKTLRKLVWHMSNAFKMFINIYIIFFHKYLCNYFEIKLVVFTKLIWQYLDIRIEALNVKP